MHVELKAGDVEGKAEPRALDDARDQVLRARGGLIEDLAGAEAALRYGGGAIVPVIFTKATLLVTDTWLAGTDLSPAAAAAMSPTKADWLWLDHQLSRSLRPSVPYIAEASPAMTKTELFDSTTVRHSRRSIAIVNVEGISSFIGVLGRTLDSVIAAEPEP